MMPIRVLFLLLLPFWAQAQSPVPTANQAAVDTLTKEVALAVFAPIQDAKAQAIYSQLLACGDGCDAQQIVRTVGGWDPIGAKLEELAMLKQTKPFLGLPAAAANAAIRRQLAQFYAKNRMYSGYQKTLTPAVQAQIMAKIDQLLPPAAEATPAAAATAQTPAVGMSATQPAPTAGVSITDTALQISRLERAVRQAEEKQIWMLLGGLAVGVLAGVGIGFWRFRRRP